MAPRKKPQAGPLSFDLGISYSMNKMKNPISPPTTPRYFWCTASVNGAYSCRTRTQYWEALGITHATRGQERHAKDDVDKLTNTLKYLDLMISKY